MNLFKLFLFIAGLLTYFFGGLGLAIWVTVIIHPGVGLFLLIIWLAGFITWIIGLIARDIDPFEAFL